jgi:hypothetical protein
VSFTVARQGPAIVSHVSVPATLRSVRLRLRLPAGETLTDVRVGSTPVPFASDGTIDLSGLGTSFDVLATVAEQPTVPIAVAQQ